MRSSDCTIISILALLFLFENQLISQSSWTFIKESEDVRLYSKKESGRKIRTYKGVADFDIPADKLFMLIEDVKQTQWWDKNLRKIEVLLYEKNKRAQYYLIYELPWPFKNRDLCVDVCITMDQTNGEHKITATPLLDVVPVSAEMIRIKDYRQVWTVKSLTEKLCRVELEFYIDPAEGVPEWIMNFLLTDSPINSIKRLKQFCQKISF